VFLIETDEGLEAGFEPSLKKFLYSIIQFKDLFELFCFA
jgi:hypothetical protein